MSSYRWICLVGCLSFVFITCSAFVGHTMLVSPFGDQKLLKIDERYDTLVIGASASRPRWRRGRAGSGRQVLIPVRWKTPLALHVQASRC